MLRIKICLSLIICRYLRDSNTIDIWPVASDVNLDIIIYLHIQLR